MGKLIERPISTLFQGVSRQPDTVRLPGQVENAKNADLSVVTGGFSKRTGSEHIAEITELGAAEDVSVHVYDRDADEQYMIMLRDQSVLVYHLDGTPKSVVVLDGTRLLGESIEATGTKPKLRLYPATGETQIDLVSTGWGTGTIDVEVSDTGAFAGEETTIHTFTSNTSATVTLSAYMRLNCTAYSSGTFKVTGTFQDVGYLKVTDLDSFSFVTVADFTFIANNEITTKVIGLGSGTIYGPAKVFDDVPRDGESVPTYLDGWAAGATWAGSDAAATDGAVWKIEGPAGEPKAYYFVKLDSSGTSWTWEEAPDPNFANDFDAAHMPHRLTRIADGSFEFAQVSWESRPVGDPTVVPDPDFIGFTIRSITFFRNRLTVIADESVFASQPGDFFNFWPDSAISVKDSDPVGLTASSNRVNILLSATPFRDVLWCTGEHQQFEVTGGDIFTSRNASITGTTEYDSSLTAWPVRLGDELYFAAESNNAAVLYEYFVDDDTISNTAANVTKHVEGYVPAIHRMTAHTSKGMVFLTPVTERNNLYIYSVYWANQEKQQSAWHLWEFGANTTEAYIHGAHVVGGKLFVLVRRDGTTFLESVNLDNDLLTTVEDFPARLDRKVFLTGIYDAGNDVTNWTLPYAHGDAITAILGADHAKAGRQLTVTYPTSTTVRAVGDWSAGDTVFGTVYTMEIELSKQFLREADTKRSLTSGRLQLRRISWNYKDTGYFEVHVTPENRDTKVYKFTGRIIGASGNTIGNMPLSAGTFKNKVGSRAETVNIKVVNATPVPCTITAAGWLGTYNEVSLQDGGLK